jgi:tetratricopeptide (TPR) repeat protein
MTHLLHTFLLVILLAGCAGRPTRIGVPAPPLGGTPPASASVQALYESGRDDEVVSRTASAAVSSEDVWFGAQSLLRVGQQAQAQDQFRRLRDTASSAGLRKAAEVALARVNGQPDAGAVARAASGEFARDPYVQFEAGVTMALEGDNAGAVQAFDAALNADQALAYAYYQSGLAYNRLNRPDLTVARFEAFVRLAPSAPERAQVDSVLRAARGGQ